jgi:hypothetical protein
LHSIYSIIFNEFFRVKNSADRNELFLTMQRLGYYEGEKPSQQALDGLGLAYKDQRAMEAFVRSQFFIPPRSPIRSRLPRG